MAQGDRGNFDRNRNARRIAEAMSGRAQSRNRVRNSVYDAVEPYGGPMTADTAASFADLLPIVGDVSGAEDAYQSFKMGDLVGGGVATAATLAGLVPGVGDAVSAGMRKAKKGFRAYHGSPHDFDKFSMDAIGTGEGAQAYGHGLYFAESEGVARSYRDALSKASLDDPLANAYDLVRLSGGDPESSASAIRAALEAGPDEESRNMLEQTLRHLEDGTWRDYKPAGKMYEVNINADPDDFLDYDTPLAEQPENVRAAFLKAKAGDDPLLSELLDTSPEGMMLQGLLPGSKGSQAYRTLAKSLGGEDIARERLREVGIPGIKYLDGMSRKAGEGSRNFVVFDDSLVEILRKYGLGGLIVGGGVYGLTQQEIEQAKREGII